LGHLAQSRVGGHGLDGGPVPLFEYLVVHVFLARWLLLSTG
jgi:hypothetical protein